MINKYIKASLLVLLMASSVSLTSCKKKDDPKPNKTEVDKAAADKAAADKAAADKAAADKAAADKAEKARVAKLLMTNKWQNYNAKEGEVFGYMFVADKVTVYNIHGTKPSIVNYTLSDDGKSITIDGKTLTFTIDKSTLTIDSLTFKNVFNITLYD